VARSRDAHLLVEAMPRLAVTVPGIELWLIGGVEAAYEAALRREAARLARAHGREVVRIFGARPHGETLALLQHAHLGVFTCPRTPVRDGAQPIKVFEYLGLGLPVLASNLEGVRGIVRHGENGVLVEPSSSDAIVDAVRSTIEITPPELIADLMAHGIALAGGGALLRGLDRRLSQETRFPVYVAEDPLTCVVRGTGDVLEETAMLAKVQARLAQRRPPR